MLWYIFTIPERYETLGGCRIRFRCSAHSDINSKASQLYKAAVARQHWPNRKALWRPYTLKLYPNLCKYISIIRPSYSGLKLGFSYYTAKLMMTHKGKIACV